MGHLKKDGTSWLAITHKTYNHTHKQWATWRKMGHLDRLLPKDGTSWLAQGPDYTQNSQSHTQWATWRKMGQLGRLLPKDVTFWLAQGPNYTQNSQSRTHTMGHLTKDGTSWQVAANGWDILTSTRTHYTQDVQSHTHTHTMGHLTKGAWDILVGWCRRMEHPD